MPAGLEIFDHHQSHAASSFFYSGFEEAAMLTVDGVGEWATTTFGQGTGSAVEILEEVHFPSSLGLLYSALTSYLGFEVNDGEYKVMGLAPYGEPRYADQVRKLVTLEEGGQYDLNLEYFDFLRRDRMYSDRLIELFGEPPRPPESDLLRLSPGRRPEHPVGARRDPARKGGRISTAGSPAVTCAWRGESRSTASLTAGSCATGLLNSCSFSLPPATPAAAWAQPPWPTSA